MERGRLASRRIDPVVRGDGDVSTTVRPKDRPPPKDSRRRAYARRVRSNRRSCPIRNARSSDRIPVCVWRTRSQYGGCEQRRARESLSRSAEALLPGCAVSTGTCYCSVQVSFGEKPRPSDRHPRAGCTCPGNGPLRADSCPERAMARRTDGSLCYREGILAVVCRCNTPRVRQVELARIYAGVACRTHADLFLYLDLKVLVLFMKTQHRAFSVYVAHGLNPLM